MYTYMITVRYMQFARKHLQDYCKGIMKPHDTYIYMYTLANHWLSYKCMGLLLTNPSWCYLPNYGHAIHHANTGHANCRAT